jgi:carbonic anhydrase
MLLALCGTAVAAAPEPSLPADEVMQLLKAGNGRHVSGNTVHDQQGAARREELALSGQRPLATILGCSDSRAPLEIIFDQGVGGIFVVRVAGNIAGPTELGSIEYGVGHLGTPVVLVLGHSSCGAVTAAVQNAQAHGNISGIVNQIRPAVAKAKEWSPNASGEELLDKSIKANVWLTMEKILRKSQEVRAQVEAGRILLVGGVYDLVSGQVAWLGQHPDQGKIIASTHAAQHKPKPKPPVKAEAETEVKEQANARSEAGESAPEASPSPKPAVKPVARPVAKPDRRQTAKPAAESTAQPEADPNARSEGQGELLASEPEPTPAKGSGRSATGKGATR